MRITCRFPVLRMIALSALLLSPAAVADARGAGGPHPTRSGHQTGPGAGEHGLDHGTPTGGEAGARGPDADLVENPRAVRARRNCGGPNRAGHAGRARRVGDCYSDSEEVWVEGAPASAPAPAAEPAPAAAKIAPERQGEAESFSSHVSDELEEQLVAARKNWMAKKELLRDVNSEWAQAQYEADRAGAAVDADVVARQASAQSEADAARAAMGPLVDQARESGMSPRLLEMYME